eukprot:768272-Hanusia_phi.AAC.11
MYSKGRHRAALLLLCYIAATSLLTCNGLPLFGSKSKEEAESGSGSHELPEDSWEQWDEGQHFNHYEDDYPMEDFDDDYSGMRDFHDFEHFKQGNGSSSGDEPRLLNDLLWDHYHLNDPTLGAAEEWINFQHFDTDKDAKVSEHEFLSRMEPDYNSPQSADDAMMRDMVDRWKHDFSENDLNHDGELETTDDEVLRRDHAGYLDWQEWQKMLFHESPQEADWVDGRRKGSVAESLENILLVTFDEGDINNDGVSCGVLSPVLNIALTTGIGGVRTDQRAERSTSPPC